MYRLNDSKVFYDIAEGQAVVINFTNGSYYEFSSLGSEVMDRLAKGADPAEVLRTIQALPDCPADMAQTMEEFLSRLLEFEIFVKEDGAGSGGGDPIPAIALEEGFAVTVAEHAEVQDILMADPVHDVDVDMGWPIMKEDS